METSDLQYAHACVESMCNTWKRLKKLWGYQVGVTKVTEKIKAWLKSDGGTPTDGGFGLDEKVWRKSTSGGMVKLSGTVVKHGSKTPSDACVDGIVLSSLK